MRTDCDDIWFTSRHFEAAVHPTAAALTGPRAATMLRDLEHVGLCLWLFVLEPGPPGAVCLWGRLRVGRRWRRIEVRVDAWSQHEAQLRLAPAVRGVRRKPPARSFYVAADLALVKLHDTLTVLVSATERDPEIQVAA